jgi:hypothetical protein
MNAHLQPSLPSASEDSEFTRAVLLVARYTNAESPTPLITAPFEFGTDGTMAELRECVDALSGLGGWFDSLESTAL